MVATLIQKLKNKWYKIDYWWRWEKYYSMVDFIEHDDYPTQSVFIIKKGQFKNYRFVVNHISIMDTGRARIHYDFVDCAVQNIEKLDFDKLVAKIVQSIIYKNAIEGTTVDKRNEHHQPTDLQP